MATRWQNDPLRLGTCSWTAKGWETAFYKTVKEPAVYIAEYAERFSTVEVDASFYGVPRETTLDRWYDITPGGFVFSAKAPKTITHDRFLEGCGRELDTFLAAMDRLKEKRGPLLFQFPYFAKRRGVTLQAFLDRLAPFLDLLPKEGYSFAVEVRNKGWITDPLLDLLRVHGVALALIDHPWMARPAQLFRHPGIVTGDFLYVRWLGDRQGIEKVTKVWNEVVVDRKADLDAWVPHLKSVLERGIRVHGYVNNHYSGYAPENVAYLEQALGSAS